MSKVYDAALTALIGRHLGDWAAFLTAHAGIAPGKASALDTDLSSTLQADQLFRVDAAVPYAVHLELQASSRLGLPERMARYNMQARLNTGLPVESVVMLLSPDARASDLTGRYEGKGAGGRTRLVFEYEVVRVWEQPIDTFLGAGPGLMPLAILTNEAVGDSASAVTRLDERLKASGVVREERADLLGDAFTLGGLRHKSDDLETTFRRVLMLLEESSTVQMLLKRGMGKGIADQARRSILTLGPKKHGPLPTGAEAALSAETDAGRLARIADRILDAADWADLLGTP